MQAICAHILLEGLAPRESLSQELISSVTTDSRKIEEGCVFVAFPGERFDGHDFAAAAIAQGAAYVVVNAPVEGVPTDKQIVCSDSYRAMMTIGANYRRQFHPKIVGITGSVGKTTTKEFCYALLCAFGKSIKTLGNQNNELGLPQTVLRLDDTIEYAAVEMGMNHAGEIARLSRCALPDVGIITSAGTAHIEHLGSRENILKAKLEICEGLAQGAYLALNYDDDYLRNAQLPSHVTPVWFSVESTQADVFVRECITAQTSEKFIICDSTYGEFSAEIPTLGKHNIADALAAYCAVTRLGLCAKTAAAALSQFEQTGMRQKVVQHAGVTVIEDCYNANPDSMAAALKMFAAYPCQKRVAFLGDMLELGAHSESAHRALGVLCAQSKLECLITYGAACEGAAQAAQAAGLRAVHTQSHEEAAQVLLEELAAGDAVLVKASRSIALERSLALFYASK